MSRKRASRAMDRRALKMEQQVQMFQPQQKKTWSIHDLKTIKPLTDNQRSVFEHFFNYQNLCITGSAGTGKTYIGIYLALDDLLQHDSSYEKIIIVRSVVPTREVGHLPGDLEEKIEIYESPYKDIFQDLLKRSKSYDDMKAAGLVEFCSTSFIRGLTWDNALILVDECQNLSWHEINSVMTRVGKNSRVILMGDIIQTDLRKKGEETGIVKLLKTVENMESFSCVEFTREDIVRSAFVKSWIIASETS